MQPQLVTWLNDTALPFAARWENPITGAVITQADVDSIKVHVTLDGVPVEGFDNLAVAVADVVSDTLQLPTRWTKDQTGFNALLILPSAALPDRTKQYQVEIVCTLKPAAVPPDGAQIVDIYLVTTGKRYAS